MAIDISAVSRETGLPPSTLRYYEEKALIASVGRQGLRRLFDASVVQRLALITLGRNAGFTLDEIRQLLTRSGREIDRSALRAKANELDQKIKELRAMRDGLRHAADCKHESQLDCPKFQRLMRVVGKGRSKRA